MEADAVVTAEELECLAQRGQRRRHRAQLLQAETPYTAAGGTVADFEEIVGVREHERAVVEVEHVELDEVAAELQRAPQRAERVLRLEGGRTFVANSQRAAWGEQLHRRRTTTIAQSSRSSPPTKRRQSSSTASASACAGIARPAARTASRRCSPYSSPALRASITPSV